MTCRKIPARELGVPGDSEAVLTACTLPCVPGEAYSPWSVLLLPGGGYRRIAPRETQTVALAFLSAGIQTFLLTYSVEPRRWPAAFLEAAAALAYLRAHAPELGLRPDRLAVCGFSAGGHLAGCLANLWRTGPAAQRLDLPPEQIRPDAVILGYPVILEDNDSIRRLTGTPALPPELEFLSLDRSVTPENPPAFLWTTGEDALVPPENTLRYASALTACGVPCELHLFLEGHHGMGTVRHYADAPERVRRRVSLWHPLCLSWLDCLQEREGTP